MNRYVQRYLLQFQTVLIARINSITLGVALIGFSCRESAKLLHTPRVRLSLAFALGLILCLLFMITICHDSM